VFGCVAADFVHFAARLGKSEEKRKQRVVTRTRCAGDHSRVITRPQPSAKIASHEQARKHEFTTRDVNATLDTMVEDAYVNHVPTLTGGVGKPALRKFYARDFIPSMPPDTMLRPLSRTIGEDRLVDEMIFSFTHSQEFRGCCREFCRPTGG
jgi:hypothetical protein